ncbi:MAG: hypothetical protein HYU30_04945 [Chloroflexi bacterium]|nr:hypothetical protein [Chloroflexota bacterium]
MIFRNPSLPLSLLASLFLILAAVSCGLRGAQPTPSPSGTGVVPSSPTPKGRVALGFASVSIEEKAQGRLTRLDIVPRHPIVASGDVTVFSVLAYDEAGRPVPSNELGVRWRATDPQVGSITSAGIFRAGAQRGVFDKSIQVTVTQTLNGRAVTLEELATVSVIRPLSENDISRVVVLPGGVQMEPNSQMLFTPLAVDRSGVPTPGVDYTWEMLEPAAGTITPDGRFTSGRGDGDFPTAIRVVAQKRIDPSQTASAIIPVSIRTIGDALPPSKVNLYPQGISVRVGDVIDFRAITLDPRGNLVEGLRTEWQLRDLLAGELDSSGRFTAGSTPGTYPSVVEVTVTSQGPGGIAPLRAVATITVLPPRAQQLLQSLILSPQVVRLRPGESRRLAATALTDLGQVVTSAQAVWSADPRVVQVTQEGLVTALDAPGSYADAVTVQVTSGEGAQQVTESATATVIILGPLDRVVVVPQEVTVNPKQVVQFTFIAYDTNGLRLFDVLATWEALDPQVGVIDNLGFFVAGAKPGQYKDVIRVTIRLLRSDQGGG